MPKTFNLYGGTPNQEGVSRAFETSVQASNAASQMKAQGAGQAAQLFMSGLSRGMEMAQQRQEAERQRGFQEQMFNRQQSAEQQRQGAYMAFQAGESAKARDFDTAKTLFGAEQEQRASQELRAFQSQQFDADWQNRMAMAQMEHRYAQEQQRREAEAKQAKQKAVDDAVFEATTFALSPQGSKQVYMPLKMSYLDALQLKGKPPEIVDREVMALFPETRPKMGAMGEGEDRSALDAKLKWLAQEIDMEVPNEIALMRGMQHLTATYGADAAKEAIGELEGRSGVKPARGIKGAREVVRAHLLDQLAAIKAAGRGAQYQGSVDPIDAAQDQDRNEDLVAPPKEFALTPEMLQRTGVAEDQIPRELAAVANLGPYAPRISVQDDGSLKFIPGQDEANNPVPVLPGAQEALDKLMSNKTIRARLLGISSTPEQDRTPAEVKDMGTLFEMLTKKTTDVPPQTSNLSTRVWVNGQQGELTTDMMKAKPTQAPATSPLSPGMIELQKYRERMRREAGGKK